MISLDIDTVRFPDGSEGELEMVRHPGAAADRCRSLSDPAGADPQLLLIKQYRYAALEYLYEIPAGRLDPGEDPTACARRELQEETGCTAGTLEHMHTMFTTPGFTDEKIHLFLAYDLTRGEAHREADEFISVEVVPLTQALDMVRDGRDQGRARRLLAILYAAGFRAGV
ncbi:MAG: NUDIX hydrolase [Gemmatimonadaceae bacterium]|nr:NUDIX hydrolase [Gemmatimonadaceae bacterium]